MRTFRTRDWRALQAVVIVALFSVLISIGRTVRASTVNSLTVNTTSDSSVAGDGLCSLREAIENANSKADITGGDCSPGTGTDAIAFSVSGTILLTSKLPAITNALT